MLIIEVDGLTHHWEETNLKDKKKQTDLEAAGFTVLRFTDDEMLNNISAVHACLEDWIGKKMAVATPGPPPVEISFISKCFPRQRGIICSLSA